MNAATTLRTAKTELQAERNRQLTRRAEIDSEIVKIDQAIKALSALIGDEQAPAILDGNQRIRAIGVKTTVIEILKDRAGEWVHASEVLTALRARGIQVSAADPKATVVTALLRMYRDREEKGENVGVYRKPGNMWRWDDHDPEQPAMFPSPQQPVSEAV